MVYRFIPIVVGSMDGEKRYAQEQESEKQADFHRKRKLEHIGLVAIG